MILLLTVMLRVDIEDVWTWIPDPVKAYTVSGAYGTLTNRTPPTNHVPATLLWRQDVLLKVSVFALRLFRHGLPTKTSLFRRDIIPSEAQLCVSGCGQ